MEQGKKRERENILVNLPREMDDSKTRISSMGNASFVTRLDIDQRITTNVKTKKVH